MSEPKLKKQDNAALEAVIEEIQNTAVALIETGTAMLELEKRMEELQKKKADIAGGQKFFMLEDAMEARKSE